jgi:hypothetical protein
LSSGIAWFIKSSRFSNDQPTFQIHQLPGVDPWTQPLRVPGNDGEFVLTHKPDPRPQWNPALYDFTPADQFDVRGTYVTKRTTRDGIGAPVVAVGREVNKEAGAKLHSAAYLLRRHRYRTF